MTAMTLKQRAVKALAWQSIAKISTQIFSFAVSILLARQLSPADFGIVGMAAIVIGFLDLVNDFGIGASIVQKKELSADDLSSVFWFSVIVSLIICSASWVSAPFIAHYFKNEQITPVVRVLSLNFVICSLRTVSYNLLNKELRFGKRSIAEIISVFFGGVVALIMVYAGFGIWSLVYNTMVQSVIMSVLVIWFAPFSLKFTCSYTRARPLINFGVKLMASRIQWYFYSNADFFIVAKVLGDKLLGYYSLAFRLATMPTEKITAVVNQVVFPLFSKLQDDREQLLSYFLKITRFVSMVTFPLSISIFILSREIILLVLTDKWLPALIPFRILCLIGMVRSVDVIMPMLLVARGKATLMLRYTTLLFLILPTAFFIGSRWGIQGVSYAWLASYPVLVIYLLNLTLREMDAKLLDYFRNIGGQVRTSIFLGIALVLGKHINTLLGQGITLLSTAIIVFVGISVYALCIRYWHMDEISEIKGLLKGTI